MMALWIFALVCMNTYLVVGGARSTVELFCFQNSLHGCSLPGRRSARLVCHSPTKVIYAGRTWRSMATATIARLTGSRDSFCAQADTSLVVFLVSPFDL